MPDPHVRAVDRVTGLDEIPVDVGVDYDTVTITIGLYTVRLERNAAELFARAFVAACWEASRCGIEQELEARDA